MEWHSWKGTLGSSPAALASQPGQIMPQFSVITLHTEGLTLARRNYVRTGIQKLSVGRKTVAEISVNGQGIINDLLQCVPVPFPNNAEA